MQNGNPVLEGGGKSRALPAGRCNALVALGERQQGCGVLEVERNIAVHAGSGEFGIEADVAAVAAVIEFAIDHEACFPTDRAQRQRLAQPQWATIASGTNADAVSEDRA